MAAVGVDVFLLAVALLAAVGQLDVVPKGVFLPLWGCFYVGVMAYRGGRSVIAIVGVAILAIALATNGGFTQTSAVTAVALFLALRSGWTLSGLSWRWLQFLGTISYSLYLLHSPITGAMGFVVRRALGDTVLASLAALVLATAASIIGAWILWAIIERPTHRLAKTLFAEKRAHRPAPEPLAAG